MEGRLNFDRVKDELCNSGRVLEYSPDGKSINDITDSVIGVHDISERVGDCCVELLIRRNGYVERMMANPVFTSHGMRIFTEDTLGKVKTIGDWMMIMKRDE